MAIKATNQSILASGQGNNISFKDMLVNLKPDSRTGKTTQKLRLIGEPMIYMEYNARRKDYDDLDEKNRPKIKNFPFPDADKKKSITRIGNDKLEDCYWASQGYQGSKKYAINCLERQPDGTFLVKILNKGATVFKPLAEYENGSLSEKIDDGVEDACTFLGGRVAREVRVTCHKDDNAPGGVRYEVHVLNKVVEITDEEIEALKAIYEPSAEDMKNYKKEYNLRKSEDPRLPSFEEFFEYGHNLRNIFKYTPPVLDEEENNEEKPVKTVSKTSKPVASMSVDEDEEEEEVPKPAKQSKVIKDEDEDVSEKPTKPSNVFAGLDTEDEDNWEL